MHQLLYGLLVIVFGVVVTPVVERRLERWPDWAWKLLESLALSSGLLIVALSDPLYDRMWGMKASPLFSTAFVFVAVGSISAFVWHSIMFGGSSEKKAGALPMSVPVVPSPVPQALLDTQIQELIALKDFLGQKDTIDEVFDMRNIIKFNIRMARRQLAPKLVTPEESKEIDDFFKGGQAVADMRYFKNVNGVLVLDAPPGVIWCINTSSLYAKNTMLLTKYQNSILLPSKVRDSIKVLGDTLDENMGVLRSVLTEKFSEKPKDIIQAEDHGSPSYGVVNGEYLMRSQPLQPREDSIVSAIRSYLDIK